MFSKIHDAKIKKECFGPEIKWVIDGRQVDEHLVGYRELHEKHSRIFFKTFLKNMGYIFCINIYFSSVQITVQSIITW